MTTTDNIKLAARMRDARKRAGLKQTDLTHIASRSQIGRIERGEVYSPETINAWADACKVSREWLRTGKEAAIVPPKVGDRWGDLTPEQRKLVPVGSVATFQTPNGPYGAVKMEPTAPGQHWGADLPDAVPYDTDDSLMPDRIITRLGTAPTEPDRSGWPVLRRIGGNYEWTPGDLAIEVADDGKFYPWEPGKHDGACLGAFDSLSVAAYAIRARLPDESEAAQTAPKPAPDPRDAEIAALTRRAESAERDLSQIGEALSRWRAPERDVVYQAIAAANYVLGIEKEGGYYGTLCNAAHKALDAAGVDGGGVPAERIAVLRKRAESAEATLDAYRIQRDQAREEAAGVRRLLDDAAGLRNAAAEACDCDDGEVPADAELARRLRELAREPQDLALVRRMVVHNTDAIRRVLSEVAPGWQVAGETALGNIELCVGVDRG